MRLPILFLSLLLSRPPAALPAIMPACARAHSVRSTIYQLALYSRATRVSGPDPPAAETVPVTQHADPEL